MLPVAMADLLAHLEYLELVAVAVVLMVVVTLLVEQVVLVVELVMRLAASACRLVKAMNKVKTILVNFIRLQLPEDTDTHQHRIPT